MKRRLEWAEPFSVCILMDEFHALQTGSPALQKVLLDDYAARVETIYHQRGGKKF